MELSESAPDEQCRISGGLGDLSLLKRYHQALKNQTAIYGAEDGFAGTLRVGHQAGDVSCLVADAGDAVEGAVRIGSFGWLALGINVAPQDLIAGLEFGEGLVVREIATFTMGDGQAQELVR